MSHTVERADGKVGSPSRSARGLTCENLEASSLRPSAVGCWSEGEDRGEHFSLQNHLQKCQGALTACSYHPTWLGGMAAARSGVWQLT